MFISESAIYMEARITNNLCDCLNKQYNKLIHNKTTFPRRNIDFGFQSFGLKITSVLTKMKNRAWILGRRQASFDCTEYLE